MLDEHQSCTHKRIQISSLVFCVLCILQELEGFEELITPLDLLFDD
jgi:hypothetical protein